MNWRLLLLSFAVTIVAPAAYAVDFTFNGMEDLRFVVPPGDESYLDGGLGKLHFGSGDGSPDVDFDQAIGQVRAQITPEIMATATGRLDPNYGAAVDLLESWVRYRPVSTNEWSWSVKAGAFFPPMSLENDEIGWTSFWTLTPSAINSWVGEELRVLGTEGTLQWRRMGGTVTLIGAVFAWNENAGYFLYTRGWTLDDRVAGLYSQIREPDTTVKIFGETSPQFDTPFKQFDGNPGWYLDLSWEPDDIGGFELMRYDNNANPAASGGGDTAWHTSFWDFGFRRQLGKVTVLAQAMDGETATLPVPTFRADTNFRSAYALAGIDLDDWWLAARADWFQIRGQPPLPDLFGEDGHAATLSASWQARSWARLTGEFVLVDSTRPERAVGGEAPRQIEKQFQLALRIYE
jgi:hypothetical protein